MITVPQLCVQPSALEVLNDINRKNVDREKIWVWYHPEHSAESHTIHEEVNCYRSPGQDQVVALDPIGKSGLSVEYDPPNQLNVCYKGEMNALVKFPKKLYPLFPNRRDLTCIDAYSGLFFVVGDNAGNIDVLENGEIRRHLDGHFLDTNAVNFFPSGEVVMSAGDYQIKIWSVIDGTNPRTFQGHTAVVNGVGLVGRGRNILSGSADGTVRLWECGSGDCVHTFKANSPVKSIGVLDGVGEKSDQPLGEKEFELGGKSVVVGTNNGLALFDLQTKKQTFNLKTEYPVTHIAIIDEVSFAYVQHDQVAIMKNLEIVNTFTTRNISCLAASPEALVVGSDTPFAVDLRKFDKTSQSLDPIYLGGFDERVSAATIKNKTLHLIGRQGSIKTYEI